MKKFAALLMVMIVSAGLLSGCSDTEPVKSVDPTEVIGSTEPEKSSVPEESPAPLEPIYVRELDSTALARQVKVFMDHRRDWTVWRDEAEKYDSVAYGLNDRDHDGRTELIIACWVGSTNTYDLKIYEIDGNGDGYEPRDVNYAKDLPENYWEGFYYTENKAARPRTPVGDLENSDLEKILTDTYLVFVGKLSNEEFYERHIALNGDLTCEELLQESIGSWGLCMTDTEGDVTYYEPGDPFYKTLVVSEDRTMILTEDAGTDSEYVIKVNLLDHADGMLFGNFVPSPADGKLYDSLLLSIVDLDVEGRLVITMDCWNGLEYLAGSSWYFERVE